MESNASGRLQAHNANPWSLNTGRPLSGNACDHLLYARRKSFCGGKTARASLIGDKFV